MSCSNPLRGRRPRVLPSTGDPQFDARLRRLVEHLNQYQQPFMGTVTAVQDDTLTVEFGNQSYVVLKPKNLRGPTDGTGPVITPVYFPGERILVIEPEGGTDDPETSNLIDANVLGRAPGGAGGGGGGGTIFVGGSDGNGAGGTTGGSTGSGSGTTTAPVFTASGGGTAGGATGSGSATFSGSSTVNDCNCAEFPDTVYLRDVGDGYSTIATLTYNSGTTRWEGSGGGCDWEFWCEYDEGLEMWTRKLSDGTTTGEDTATSSCSGTLSGQYGGMSCAVGDVEVRDTG